MDGDRNVQFASELPLRPNNILLAETAATSRQAHGEQAVVGAEVGVPDPTHVVARIAIELLNQ